MKTLRSSRVPLFLSAGVLLWSASVVVASWSGWLGSLPPLAPPPIAGLTILIPVLFYYSLAKIRSYLAGVGLRRLTAVHILRIAAVPLFFWYGRRGLLPQPFVQAAGWGDLAAGLIAFVVVAFWARAAGYWTAHILGMADFITAFAIAIRLTRASPRAMLATTGLPMALIPFFGVGVLATIHLIAYDLLLRGKGQPVNDLSPLNVTEAR